MAPSNKKPKESYLISIASEDKNKILELLGLPNVFPFLEGVMPKTRNIHFSPYANEELYIGQRPSKLDYIVANQLKKTFKDNGLVLTLFRLQKVH